MLRGLRYGERIFLLPRVSLPLQAGLSSCGHCRERSHDYDWHGLKRGPLEFCLFQYTLSGEGRLRIGEAERAVRPGEALLLFFPHENRYWLPRESRHWEFLYLCFYGRELLRIWRSLSERMRGVARFERDAGCVQFGSEITRRAIGGQVSSAYESSALAYDFVMRVAADLDRGQPLKPRPPEIERAIQFAEHHLAEQIGVDDLARAAGLSRWHFSRLFADLEGTPPVEYLQDLRVRHAAALLRQGRRALAEIAALSGFREPAYLCRVFKRRIGMTPHAFRRSGMY